VTYLKDRRINDHKKVLIFSKFLFILQQQPTYTKSTQTSERESELRTLNDALSKNSKKITFL
jgi:hypothetical protein